MANRGYRIRVLTEYRLPTSIIPVGEYDIDSPILEGAGNWLVAVGVAELIEPEKPVKKGNKNA